MNIINKKNIKKNKIIFKNIFLFTILFFCVLINSKFNSVYGVGIQNFIDEKKASFRNELEELEELEKKDFSTTKTKLNEIKIEDEEEKYKLFKEKVLDLIDENQKKTIYKTFLPKLNKCLVMNKNENADIKKIAEQICNYLFAINLSNSMERNQLIYNFFIFGEPFLK